MGSYFSLISIEAISDLQHNFIQSSCLSYVVLYTGCLRGIDINFN